jgi:hypothetical protein
MKQNEWKKIGKLEKKEIKIFRWTTYTTQRGNSWSKMNRRLGKLKILYSSTGSHTQRGNSWSKINGKNWKAWKERQ